MHKQAQQVIELFQEKILKVFSNRVVAIYALGSLGTHGDFSACSDVDVAVILNNIEANDKETIQAIWDEIKSLPIDYADRLSVFWSSSTQFAEGEGRFPALDRLDLIEHGQLLYGDDCRAELIKPSGETILKESAAFIIDSMLTPEKQDELENDRYQIVAKGARYFSKFVLFPVRLLFTIKYPETVASNKQAVEAFVANHSDEVVALVECAYQARQSQPYAVVDIDDDLLDLLPDLYTECLDSYAEVLEITVGENDE